jgi:hypothetical protein
MDIKLGILNGFPLKWVVQEATLYPLILWKLMFLIHLMLVHEILLPSHIL